MPAPQGYFAARPYAILMGLTSIGGCALNVSFIVLGAYGLVSEALQSLSGSGLWFSNRLFVVIATQPGVAIIFLLGGCISGFLFGYLPLVEFGTRARPVAVDASGVRNFLFGMRLRFFPWSQVRKLVKLRARHPLGWDIEFVRILSNPLKAYPQRQNETAPSNAKVAGAATGWLKLLPFGEIWLPSYVDHKAFPTACDILTYYALLHHIPMEFWDMTSAGKRSARKQG